MKLFLCEKPSQANDIGRVLFGGIRQENRKQGYLQKGDLAISWAVGHILTDATPEKYGKQYEQWKLETLPLIPQKWIKEIPEKLAPQFKVLQKLVNKADEVVIATDADREGEVIAREILDYCGFKGKISRFWTSGLDAKSVKTALGKIKPDAATRSLYYAGLARQRADWLWGMNLSRAYTVAYADGIGKEHVLSVGRIQTPTLALIVRRDEAIANFKPYDHYGITIECEKDDDSGETFLAHWQIPEHLKNKDGFCTDLAFVQKLSGSLNDTKTQITEAKLEHKKTPPPLPYSLSELQKEASRKFQCSAGDVLKAAQSLYEKHKLTSYPRTPCQYLPESQKAEVASVFEALIAVDKNMAGIIAKANPNRDSRVWNDTQVNKHSHHAIIPTMNLSGNLKDLSELERNIYDMIRRRYIAQFYPDYEYASQIAVLEVENQTFKATGKTPLKQGWKVLFGQEEEKEEGVQSKMPALKTGDTVMVIAHRIDNKTTTAPPKFTEATLLDEMKTLSDFFKTVDDENAKKVLRATQGLGTEATRAAVIERLYQVGYIEKKKQQISATAKGKKLIAKVPKIITDPVMTAKWETALSGIEEGKISLQQFMDLQAKTLTQLIEDTRKQM